MKQGYTLIHFTNYQTIPIFLLNVNTKIAKIQIFFIFFGRRFFQHLHPYVLSLKMQVFMEIVFFPTP